MNTQATSPKKKRELLYTKIFDGKIISNHNHYELAAPNKAIIGCNLVKKEGDVFALALDKSCAYLLRGKKNLSPEKIREIMPDPKLTERWVYKELRRADILPHGGGHRLNEFDGIDKILLYPRGKIMIPKCGSMTGKMAYVDMMEVSRGYRSDGILDRVISLKLGDLHAALELVYCIKADFE